jgi:hypothetical protein
LVVDSLETSQETIKIRIDAGTTKNEITISTYPQLSLGAISIALCKQQFSILSLKFSENDPHLAGG